mgnify:CR=1 FL=1
MRARDRFFAAGGGRGGPSGSRLPLLAAAVVLVGLLATVPVLRERARVEAAYRQVTLVAEVRTGAWESALTAEGFRWPERGVGALLVPAEALHDGGALQAVAASGLGAFVFWQGPPAPDELARATAQARAVGLEPLIIGGVDGGAAGSPMPASWAGALLEAAGVDGLQVGLVELEGSSFWAQLARQRPDRVVVAHWVPPQDWEAYRGPGADQARLARYVRAVRERNVRVLVVPVDPGDRSSVAFLDAVARRLEELGYTLGPVPAVPPFDSGRLARAMMGAGVGGGLWLLGWTWRRAWSREGTARRDLAALLAAAAVGGLIACLPQVHLPLVRGVLPGRALIAWLAGVAFPLVAVLSLQGVFRTQRPTMWPPVRGLLQATLISVAGGVLVAGLLSSREALFRLELFRGVKAQHLLPPLLAAVALLPQPARSWLVALRASREPARLKEHRTWLGLAFGLVGAGILGALMVYYVGRTGNELVPVPQWERVLRDQIEAFLGTRPRFKELFGHGILLAGLMVQAGLNGQALPPGQAGGRALASLGAAVLLVVGSVGQLSVVNTFAHLHQPLGVIAQRVGYGLIGGLILGLLLGFGLRWGLGRWAQGTASQGSGRR